MLTTAGRDAAITGNTSVITHVGLLTAITSWRAGTVTEATFTGYGRASITWGAAGDTTAGDGRKKSNSAAVTFAQNTGSNQDVIAYGLYSASTAGTLHGIGLLDTDQPIIGTTDASTDLITAYAHGLEADQRVFFLKSPGGQAPDVFSENTAYYVLSTGLTADAFKLSTSSGGAAVNATVSGQAMFIPYKAQTVATNAVMEFAIGAIEIQI